MGQLIKLQDYVSRYEQNIYNYPSRFVRLKKQQWDSLYSNWEDGLIIQTEQTSNFDSQFFNEIETVHNETMLQKVKGLFGFNRRKDETDLLSSFKENVEDEDLTFSPNIVTLPETVTELKQQYLDQLFRFQMKWASSTLTEQSVVNEYFYFDQLLKYFLQRFPDNMLVLYKPIFLIKKAPVEAEVVLITPTEVQCISFIEKADEAVFIGTNEHFWEVRTPQNTEKVLNPILASNRIGNIVTDIFRHYEIDLPIKKIILSRNGYIDYPLPPFDVNFVEKRNYEDWFKRLRTLSSPLKHVQLKAANALLQHCQTTSYKRLAWEDNDKENELFEQ